ncbi:helix-turn-helix domain-containing protein [Streptacidiphilus sp. N1-3]|uniref:Helix-turn-helix domain-containing protein n=1 Tax=Streptacidiphilus alkalitolerans TaxID=3342712 RepID=A0ABV6XCL2_9ACTN
MRALSGELARVARMDISGIGHRVAYWRVRRGLTQSDFGALMGRSRRWVQDLEGGQRGSAANLAVLDQAAAVLEVRLEQLLADERADASPECVDAAELAAIRAALQHPEVVTGAGDSRAKPVDALRRDVAYGWTAFQAADYTPLGRLLPGLLREATRTAHDSTGHRQDTAFSLLAMTLMLTTAVCTKFGDHPLAYRAADRSVQAAERSGDPVVMAASARHLVDGMFHGGEGLAAIALAAAVAQRLEADLVARGPHGLSALGMLHLKAAIAAAHIDDRAAVPDLLDAAKQSADRMGVDGNAMWTAFGPTNVQLHRVSAAIRLYDGPGAVSAAQGIDATARDALPRERRANHLVDLARGQSLAGRRPQAVDTLLRAEGLAPQEVHCRPQAAKLVADLRLLGVGSAEGRLRALADRCGLPR